ncbi:MAG: T9SS type A sorting domain-containing protein [Bacteroidales bacterium]|nr:T9SS type A sorting domain-containing protein [Bacteroidales bacterium]
MRKPIVLTILVLSSVALAAQTAIGTFTAHTAMHAFSSVAADATTIYAASENGLMLLEKNAVVQDNPEISTWTKVDGLSDVGIVKIFSEKAHNSLIICYANGNIDVIQNDRLTNIRDVKDKSLTGSKILQICREIDGKIYLVYPFGIVVLDMAEMVVMDTWFTKRGEEQFTPTDVAMANQRFYISTTGGVFSMQKTSPAVSNFSQWDQETTMRVSFLSSVGDEVLAVKTVESSETGEWDTLYQRTDEGWQSTGRCYQLVRYMSAQYDTLIVCNWDGVELLNGEVERIYNAVWYTDGNYPDVVEAVLDGDNIWAADKVYGLVQNNMTYYTHRFFGASGPYMDYVERVTSRNGVVAAVHGTRRASTAYAPGFRFPALSWYLNGEWQHNSTDFLYFNPDQPTYDLTNVAISPKNENEWALASWGNGLFVCQNQRPVAHYNARNSPLDSISNGQTFVSGLQYDKKGNVWLTNSYCQKMLKMLEPDGTWHAYNIAHVLSANSIGDVVADKLLVDSRGYKWMNFPRDGVVYHLIAFTDNGTYDNTGDDRIARIDMNVAAEVTSSTVYCMAEDLDGEIWIGTDKGVKVIYYPGKVFDGGVYPRNILLEQDGYVSVLLEFEEVTAIAVDGANRKWIGTNKAGVFLMSENGQEQLLHFTAEDHPLFSNSIVDINVNDLTGEVFFATSNGMVSYKGTATGGFETYEDLPVYPNPVPHGYTGVIAVNGLKANSLCKITDASGKLVWQGYSDGGQLVWYGKDFHGHRPATGVYYVMVSDESGKEKLVTKFVFVN